jgi:hypothetical protein
LESRLIVFWEVAGVRNDMRYNAEIYVLVKADSRSAMLL